MVVHHDKSKGFRWEDTEENSYRAEYSFDVEE